MPIDSYRLAVVSGAQSGAISRAQVLEAGAEASWIARQVRIGRWNRLLPGVYVTHAGPVGWSTRAAAALLYCGRGAGLSHASAAYVWQLTPSPPRLVEVSVPSSRRVQGQRGLRVHVRRRMPLTYGVPVAVNPADTVLDVAESSERVDDVVGIVCGAARARVRPAEIARALERRPRARHRGLLLELLADVAEGIESPLERRFRRDVERRHALPPSRVQVRERLAFGWIRADARYEQFGVRAELDGALAHPAGRTDADTWRDNAVLIERGELTLRYRWYHVAVRPCDTARQVETALRSRGWTGHGRSCDPECPVGAG